ncbi:hypothetical protein NEFER03_2173 [Nematocida sp. LUAm3]|nr:hypothetical protein NEFER03_2173 [Nematocida sp. LUAm3]KAI5176281.1 hypothetical protein NEFER02_2073 [Nematocida sp. LUAm2]KAI5179247.1 hypothetical protein NEFER01_2101 [Nematocida sp. LUAm1]
MKRALDTYKWTCLVVLLLEVIYADRHLESKYEGPSYSIKAEFALKKDEYNLEGKRTKSILSKCFDVFIADSPKEEEKIHTSRKYALFNKANMQNTLPKAFISLISNRNVLLDATMVVSLKNNNKKNTCNWKTVETSLKASVDLLNIHCFIIYTYINAHHQLCPSFFKFLNGKLLNIMSLRIEAYPSPQELKDSIQEIFESEENSDIDTVQKPDIDAKESCNANLEDENAIDFISADKIHIYSLIKLVRCNECIFNSLFRNMKNYELQELCLVECVINTKASDNCNIVYPKTFNNAFTLYLQETVVRGFLDLQKIFYRCSSQHLILADAQFLYSAAQTQNFIEFLSSKFLHTITLDWSVYMFFQKKKTNSSIYCTVEKIIFYGFPYAVRKNSFSLKEPCIMIDSRDMPSIRSFVVPSSILLDQKTDLNLKPKLISHVEWKKIGIECKNTDSIECLFSKCRPNEPIYPYDVCIFTEKNDLLLGLDLLFIIAVEKEMIKEQEENIKMFQYGVAVLETLSFDCSNSQHVLSSIESFKEHGIIYISPEITIEKLDIFGDPAKESASEQIKALFCILELFQYIDGPFIVIRDFPLGFTDFTAEESNQLQHFSMDHFYEFGKDKKEKGLLVFQNVSICLAAYICEHSRGFLKKIVLDGIDPYKNLLEFNAIINQEKVFIERNDKVIPTPVIIILYDKLKMSEEEECILYLAAKSYRKASLYEETLKKAGIWEELLEMPKDSSKLSSPIEISKFIEQTQNNALSFLHMHYKRIVLKGFASKRFFGFIRNNMSFTTKELFPAEHPKHTKLMLSINFQKKTIDVETYQSFLQWIILNRHSLLSVNFSNFIVCEKDNFTIYIRTLLINIFLNPLNISLTNYAITRRCHFLINLIPFMSSLHFFTPSIHIKKAVYNDFSEKTIIITKNAAKNLFEGNTTKFIKLLNKLLLQKSYSFSDNRHKIDKRISLYKYLTCKNAEKKPYTCPYCRVSISCKNVCDLVITTCGHMLCYDCVKISVKSESQEQKLFEEGNTCLVCCSPMAFDENNCFLLFGIGSDNADPYLLYLSSLRSKNICMHMHDASKIFQRYKEIFECLDIILNNMNSST